MKNGKPAADSERVKSVAMSALKEVSIQYFKASKARNESMLALLRHQKEHNENYNVFTMQ